MSYLPLSKVTNMLKDRLICRPRTRLLGIVLIYACVVQTPTTSEANDIKRDENIQEMINEELSFRRLHLHEYRSTKEAMFHFSPASSGLRQYSTDHPKETALQFLYYMQSRHQIPDGYLYVSLASTLLNELVDKNARLNAISPYIEDHVISIAERQSSASTSRIAMETMLQSLCSSGQAPSYPRPSFDFSVFGNFLSNSLKNHEALNSGIICYMLLTSPNDALKVLNLVYGKDSLSARERKSIEAKARSITDKIEARTYHLFIPGLFRCKIASASHQLDILSRNSHWWVRLYVAEQLRTGPEEFRKSAVLQRINSDECPLVRAWIAHPPRR